YASFLATASDDHGVMRALDEFSPYEVVVPHLEDEDIEALLDALTDGNRLGRLAGLPRKQQFTQVQQRAGRQLLVAMLEATSGQKFEDKIQAECDSLASDLRTAYAVVALATSYRYALGVDDLLAALSMVSTEGLDVI